MHVVLKNYNNTGFGDLKQSAGFNFINVLRAAFTLADSECAKRLSNCQCCLALLGPASVKAAHKTSVKLTPGDPKMNRYPPVEKHCSRFQNETDTEPDT